MIKEVIEHFDIYGTSNFLRRAVKIRAGYSSNRNTYASKSFKELMDIELKFENFPQNSSPNKSGRTEISFLESSSSGQRKKKQTF